MNIASPFRADRVRARAHRETIPDIELGLGVVLLIVVLVLMATVPP